MSNRRFPLGRRSLLAATGTLAISALLPDLAKAAEPFSPLSGPRSRVLFVNDLSGDVDGLFALAHQILSPSAELRGIIGTTPRERDSSAKRSAELAEEMLALMDMPGSIPIYTGAEQQMQDMVTPVASDGSDAIIAEAMRTDSELPLYIAVGGGLTEVASAVLQEPKIADRFTLVWIGGDALPDGGTGETNFNIDPLAAQFLFNESTVRIWQVPRSAYAQCLVSATELQTNVGRYGKIGPWLQDRLFDVTRKYGMRFNTGETWNLGDNPLVLLTALTDWVPSNRQPPLRFERTGSSLFDEVTAPAFNPDGTFTLRDEGRTIRVYRNIDTRMLFADFFAKMQVNFERA